MPMIFIPFGLSAFRHSLYVCDVIQPILACNLQTVFCGFPCRWACGAIFPNDVDSDGGCQYVISTYCMVLLACEF